MMQLYQFILHTLSVSILNLQLLASYLMVEDSLLMNYGLLDMKCNTQSIRIRRSSFQTQCTVHESRIFYMRPRFASLKIDDNNDCYKQYFWINCYVEDYIFYADNGVIIIFDLCNTNVIWVNQQAHRDKFKGNCCRTSFNTSAMIDTFSLKMEDFILDNFNKIAIRIRRSSFQPPCLIIIEKISCKIRKIKRLAKIEKRYGSRNFVYTYLELLYFIEICWGFSERNSCPFSVSTCGHEEDLLIQFRCNSKALSSLTLFEILEIGYYL